jgi:arylsulfatase A-like enzyme
VGMMSSKPEFSSYLKTIWFRLVTLAVVGCVFYEALGLARGTAQGWSFYLTGMEVGFEVLVRLVAAAVAGFLVGTVATLGIAPILGYFKTQRERIVDWVTKLGVIAFVFVMARYALIVLIQWAGGTWSDPLTPTWSHSLALVKISLIAYYLAFAVALCFPRSRKEITSSLDGMLTPQVTRRTAVATVVGTAGLIATEYAFSRRFPTVQAAQSPQRPKPNILLISFDALSAEDMSLYGRTLPTTPNIDAFARKSTVFTNFYSAYTFTTPCIATMMTGLYPSETGVFQIQGRIQKENAGQTVPYLLQKGGYATGGFFSNPWAYYLSRTAKNDFSALPEPVFQKGGLQRLWELTRPLHQDSGIGCRVEEYWDLQRIYNHFGRIDMYLPFEYRPAASFEHARKILANLPDGFFVWVHLIAPHFPYIPDARDSGLFLPEAEQRIFEKDLDDQWQPHYDAAIQPQIDRRRLLYDEFVVSSDRAFGAFMADFGKSGRANDTAVIVSADHGESFEGGVYQHSTPYLTRPVIHVPLVVRTPGQQDGRTVNYTADQTALAPTILELAGQPRPSWMGGQSLVPWLERNGQGEGEGAAFCQYLAKNDIYKPIKRGTLGVIEGGYQYVVYIDTQKGELRPLNEAQIWDLDRSAEHPEKAAALRQTLHAKFPDLVKPTA